MKIGIVTQPLLNNYGGVLQNFAMQHALRKLGHEPITCDYIPRMSRGRFVKIWLRNFFYNLFHTTKRALPTSRVSTARHPYFKAFIDRHISCTKSIHKYTPKLISEYQLEALIAGSDQVWRPRYNRKVLTSMFLDFVEDRTNVKKVAYAASFGVDYWEYRASRTRKCRKFAKRLDAISVRENSGIALCRDNLRVEAIEVLDPTLLLTADDYKAICVSVPQSKERYVAAYILDATPEKVALVEQEAQRRGVGCRIYGAGHDVELTIEEWLSLFRDSEFVITDSFHGCVFSIIFRREFAAIINRKRGASRFVSLFGKFGLLDRIVIDAARGILPSQPIDWTHVERELQRWQNLSIDYLNRALCR